MNSLIITVLALVSIIQAGVIPDYEPLLNTQVIHHAAPEVHHQQEQYIEHPAPILRHEHIIHQVPEVHHQEQIIQHPAPLLRQEIQVAPVQQHVIQHQLKVHNQEQFIQHPTPIVHQQIAVAPIQEEIIEQVPVIQHEIPVAPFHHQPQVIHQEYPEVFQQPQHQFPVAPVEASADFPVVEDVFRSNLGYSGLGNDLYRGGFIGGDSGFRSGAQLQNPHYFPSSFGNNLFY